MILAPVDDASKSIRFWPITALALSVAVTLANAPPTLPVVVSVAVEPSLNFKSNKYASNVPCVCPSVDTSTPHVFPLPSFLTSCFILAVPIA